MGSFFNPTSLHWKNFAKVTHLDFSFFYDANLVNIFLASKLLRHNVYFKGRFFVLSPPFFVFTQEFRKFEPRNWLIKTILKMNIIPLITRYLLHNRRLVVPQLGAFIRKAESDEIIFSEMLKRDDGVLRRLLEEEGLSELEAMGVIDRFLFELRHTVEAGSVFQAEGLGVFALGENGTLRFRYLPHPAAVPQQETTPSVTQPEEQPAKQSEGNAAQEPIEGNVEEEGDSKEFSEADQTRRRIKELMHFDNEHPRENRSSSQPHRDPALRGLSYGKPQKTTDAFTYINSAPSRRPDKFIILAIAAVVIALGAILYGYLKDRKQERIEREYLEQITNTEMHSAETE